MRLPSHSGQGRNLAARDCYFFPALCLAQRALAARESFCRAAADSFRVFFLTFPTGPLRLAHRAFCASEMAFRAARERRLLRFRPDRVRTPTATPFEIAAGWISSAAIYALRP